MAVWWEISKDLHGLPSWRKYIECSHWGLIFTGEYPRYDLTTTINTDFFVNA